MGLKLTLHGNTNPGYVNGVLSTVRFTSVYLTGFLYEEDVQTRSLRVFGLQNIHFEFAWLKIREF